MADDKCVAVPLVEQLRSVPLNAKLLIDTPNALGCMDTRSIPVGRLCHEATKAIGVKAPPELNGPGFTDWGRAALLWVLWHHQGGSSKVGQPIRFALGMGEHDRLTSSQIADAKRWAELSDAAGVTDTPYTSP